MNKFERVPESEPVNVHERLAQYDSKLQEAENLIKEVEGMVVGSREQYDAAFRMREKIEGNIANPEVLGNVDYNATLEILAEGEEEKNKVKELENRRSELREKMMSVWRGAKEAYDKSSGDNKET